MSSLSTLALVHLLAVIVPGPDFALITRASILGGSKSGLLASLGLALGVLVHVSYVLAGYGALLARYPSVMQTVRALSAAYLAYLAWQALSSALSPAETVPPCQGRDSAASVQALRSGLLTNLLNPKAVLYFLAVVPHALAGSSDGPYRVAATLFTVTLAWFSFVALALSSPVLRGRFLRRRRLIDGVVGAGFLVLAAGMGVDILSR
jgi:threonine/homoserine/homoserine lactone efflux protein